MKPKKLLLILTGIIALMALIFFVGKKIKRSIEENIHREWVAGLDHSASKNVQILKDTIHIPYLDIKRTLALYLPEGYDQDTVEYPVLYFLDGQSLFDQKIKEGTEWEVDEVLDSVAVAQGKNAIVIGIYNADDRLVEYKPFPSDRIYSDKVVHGDKHADWIVKDLKPWIDERFRTKKDPASTIIGGASLAGLMSYYMLMTYPETFGAAIVFSPSFWVHEQVYNLHETNDSLKSQRIYFDAGELETPTVESVYKMEEILLKAGMKREQIKTDIEPGEGHWHATWVKGFKKAYPWILPAPN
ncbi:MAG: alpha/beta hydrolase [Saprospiraceae bacterium]|nr:alpha/beta hydrolase [Saprospiraceae bacterium]